MSSTGIFLVGFFITLVVFVALGILAYGIALERGDLDAEKLEKDTVRESARPAAPAPAPASALAAPDRSSVTLEPQAVGART